MIRQDDLNRYRHMLDCAREAVSLAKAKTRSDVDSDRLLNLALVRLLEIIGEAANRVSREECSGHPEIPWSQIIGMRNRLIHGYDSVDFDILWEIVTGDLPALIVHLEAILGTK